MEPREPVTPGSRTVPALRAAAVSAGLALLKAAAWLLTGSVAMLASMVDSAADAVISAGNFMALRAADRPADREHPFGHGSIEDLAALVQSFLIFGSGVVVVTAALTRFTDEPTELANIPLGIGTALVSMLIAWTLARYLRRAGQVMDSPALEADSEHYTSDYLANLGVSAAFIAHGLFSQPLLDPAVSLCIALLIFKTAWGRFITAAHSIMDRELDESSIQIIDEVVKSFAPQVHGYHDLLTRRSGPDRFVQFHMEVDADLSFRQAHDVTESVTEALRARLPRAHVTIHPDPWPEDDHAEPRLPHARASAEEKGT